MTGSVLDGTLELFARHAVAAERFRLPAIAFHPAKAQFETQRALREQVCDARRHAASHREHVHTAVTRYVTHLRDIGTPPERVLVRLRERIAAALCSFGMPRTVRLGLEAFRY